jgi:hypothetical protein
MPTSTSTIFAGCAGGWDLRNVRGSHHAFRMQGVEERLNLQESGAKAKPYQVRKVRAVLVRHRLTEDE